MPARKAENLATAATEALAGREIAFAIHPFDNPKNLEHESDALPIESFDQPDRVYRSILCRFADGYAVLLVPIDRYVDLDRASAALGVAEISAVSPADVEKQTGYPISALTPLGMRNDAAVLVDLTAVDHHTVFISAGQLGYVIELSPDDLLEATGGRTAPIARL